MSCWLSAELTHSPSSCCCIAARAESPRATLKPQFTPTLTIHTRAITHAEAILDAAGEALSHCPSAAHVAVCSGHDVPVARVPPGALQPGVTLFTDFRCDSADKTVEEAQAGAAPCWGCLPLTAVNTHKPGPSTFKPPPRFGYEFEEEAQEEVAEVLAAHLGLPADEARAWGASLVFHHTWMVLAR